MVTFLSKDSDNKGWSWNSNPALFDYITQAFIHYSVHLCVCVCVYPYMGVYIPIYLKWKIYIYLLIHTYIYAYILMYIYRGQLLWSIWIINTWDI